MRDHIERLTNLPTLPQMACRLMETLGGGLASAGDVAAIVRQDISLSAKILRLANSAFYGVPRTISNLTDAVVLLGTKVIATMVLSLSVFDMFAEKGNERFDRREFWRHALVCAATGRLIAGRLSKELDPEDVFCACLLHDIGKIVMEQYLQDDMRRVMDAAVGESMSFWEAEKSLLDYTHIDVAAWLTSKWNLPSVIIEPMMGHHEPAAVSGGNRRAAYVCHLADHFSYDSSGVSGGGYAPPRAPDTLEVVGPEAGDLAWVRSRIGEEMNAMQIFREVFLAT